MDKVHVTITPHFDISRGEFIITEILPLTYGGTIYGICDDGTIVIQNGVKQHSIMKNVLSILFRGHKAVIAVENYSFYCYLQASYLEFNSYNGTSRRTAGIE